MNTRTSYQLSEFAPIESHLMRVASLVTGISILALKGGK